MLQRGEFGFGVVIAGGDMVDGERTETYVHSIKEGPAADTGLIFENDVVLSVNKKLIGSFASHVELVEEIKSSDSLLFGLASTVADIALPRAAKKVDGEVVPAAATPVAEVAAAPAAAPVPVHAPAPAPTHAHAAAAVTSPTPTTPSATTSRPALAPISPAALQRTTSVEGLAVSPTRSTESPTRLSAPATPLSTEETNNWRPGNRVTVVSTIHRFPSLLQCPVI
jgi:hypothetical protein